MTKFRLIKSLILVLCALFYSAYALTQTTTFLDESDKSFIKLKQVSIAFFEAVKSRDSIGMSSGLAEEFTLTSTESNGELMRKSGYINGSLRPDILKVIYFKMHDFKIRKYNEIAIVQSRIDWKSEYKGLPWNADFLITDVFVFRDKRWQIVHRHSSYPANYLKKAVEMRKK